MTSDRPVPGTGRRRGVNVNLVNIDGERGDQLTTRRSRGAPDTYHHGNLRQALLERDVQRMAGVSNSAAYRHYADRDALLAAVTEYAEALLADAMVARLNAVPRR